MTTTPPEEQRGAGEIINATRFVSPNGPAYDPARQRLYVADQGNDRVMVFDVAVERVANQPTALAVLGAGRRLKPVRPGTQRPVGSSPDYTTRVGLAFDSVNQHLYVMDSHWARLMVFSFPSSRHALTAPSNGVAGVSSLDPILALRQPEQISGYGIVRGLQAGCGYARGAASAPMSKPSS